MELIAEKIEKLSNAFGDLVLIEETKPKTRFFIEVAPENLVKVVMFIFDELGGRLATASGVDVREGFEVVYHFCFDADHAVVNLRTRTGKDFPEVDSLAPFIAGAGFIEREMHDLLGIGFKGHPDMRRLILSDDWPEGVYPLRKDFEK